uniref:ADAM 17-like protease isoform X1 n=1 Tax=Crassostrea virginica TaxID=6565 RepID=A0A8B8DK26_CRAVI|nr:ADAM 17-like protease isoform X1 [Crassostrea virginica]XP_022328507.1 ADAM 17-like protease isoform X3 [Crassostrea virginica]
MFVLKIIAATIYFMLLYRRISGDISQTLHRYDSITDFEIHSISERDVTGMSMPRKRVKFSGRERNYSVVLTPVTGLFTDDLKTVFDDGNGRRTSFVFNKNNFFEGILEGDKKSNVHAYFDDDDTMTATITSEGEEIVVEPEWRHMRMNKKSSRMIMYSVKDMKWPNIGSNSTGYNFCGATHGNELHNTQEIMFSQHMRENKHHRTKRAANVNCRLITVADYKFYQSMGNSNKYTTANYMASVIAKANLIYRNTNFGGYSGLGFLISEMVIHTSATVVSDGILHYNMANGPWRSNTKALLDSFSSQANEWSSYCLAHLFTHQPFDNNVLGLAYIAGSRASDIGGLCSPLTYLSGVQVSLNTGFTSTMYSSGSTVLARQAELVTAHELGHNWGSEHDPTSGDCAPFSLFGGKYLMYPYSVSGDDENNERFSSCSKNYIARVLNAKLGCLTESATESLCGNGRIDPGEACDGGYLGKFGLDECCNKDCTLNSFRSAVCTPANHGCCSTSCQVQIANTFCNAAQECKQNAFCDGSSLTCPVGANKPTGTSCTGGFCNGGSCQPFCEYAGRISCACSEEANSCRRCCKLSSTGTCSPYNNTVYLTDGSPCSKGYCSGGVCVETEPSLSERFFELLDKISIDFLAETFKTNMVAIIQAFSLVLFIPLSCLVWCRDRQKQKLKRIEMNAKCRYDRTLTFDEDRRQVKKKKKVQPKFIPAPPEAVNHRMGSRGGSRRNQVNPIPPKRY